MGTVTKIRRRPKVVDIADYQSVVVIPLTESDKVLVTFDRSSPHGFPVGPINADEYGDETVIKILEVYTGLRLKKERFHFITRQDIKAVRTYSYAILLSEKELNSVSEMYEHLRSGIKVAHIETVMSMNFYPAHLEVLKTFAVLLPKMKIKKR